MANSALDEDECPRSRSTVLNPVHTG